MAVGNLDDLASQTLDLVGRELNEHARRGAHARSKIYVEQPDNVALLRALRPDLHQVQGVLRVLEIYGAALLAEEMEQVARLPAARPASARPGRRASTR